MTVVDQMLPVVKGIYDVSLKLAWLGFIPVFLLSCVVEYVKNPVTFPVVDMLKRIFITAFLLSTFPHISSFIAEMSQGLADSYSEGSTLEKVYDRIKVDNETKDQGKSAPDFLFADTAMSIVGFLIYAFVFIAKMMIGYLFHFNWALLTCVAPLAICCTLFPGQSHITLNLFASLIEISLWDVLLRIVGVIILGLHIYPEDGRNYFDVICFNIFVAFIVLQVPKIIHTFLRGGISPPGNPVKNFMSVALPALMLKTKLASLAAKSAAGALGKSKNKNGVRL